ncbi:aldehyde dehydrogenase (NADP(+)) [Pseudoroseicyclus aestuarii]|uniref:NADP-dependent aldehyde dehydrogenase n=1 Tax=Pseudoroseicyclus aestuarii TaxID=1795041 RepID=A0A318SZQ3_9RHOB|nr:aldehyde dehydrogenase (NADP(+)) [Pseudoroseicyclus aestuarii]PYE85906.1 NADP-dependent aldehyde dehydrogenase [Pseudoroseicyclus aestuarii]
MTQGAHWIAGDPVTGGDSFHSDPATGEAQVYPKGTTDLVDRAVRAAEDAFPAFSATTREERAVLLEKIAEEIEARVDAITEVAMAESGLPEPRIRSVELPRTCNQLRLFASHIRDGAYLDRRHDDALPDRKPLPRPDLRLMQVPIGPVAVFGASNFPLAFSTAGGDTASALAAGCPVVNKGHPGHPGTTSLVAEAVSAAVKACNMPSGTFSMVHDGGTEIGRALVEHPLIAAVGFTGSLRGGRALFDLCAKRPNPIPFFGELGSINPMFCLPAAMGARAADIGKAWAGSLAMGAGQFCTNPGVAFVVDGPAADQMIESATAALDETPAQTMLTSGIAEAFRSGSAKMKDGTTHRFGEAAEGRNVTPWLLQTDGDTWAANEDLAEEVFGPLGLVVRVRDEAQMTELAHGLHGQLTATLQMDDEDQGLAARLLPVLTRKAGRVLANGFPTGVEVADAMVHGGPYPASTNFGATSVGTMAIRRWLRPVSYQNIPEALLPADLQKV